MCWKIESLQSKKTILYLLEIFYRIQIACFKLILFQFKDFSSKICFLTKIWNCCTNFVWLRILRGLNLKLVILPSNKCFYLLCIISWKCYLDKQRNIDIKICLNFSSLFLWRHQTFHFEFSYLKGLFQLYLEKNGLKIQ